MAKENLYELVVIFDSQGEEEQIKREFDIVQSLIEKRCSKFVGRAEWGLQKFVYPIKKRTEGYYVYYLFGADADVPGALSSALKMDEKILRHLIVKAKSTAQDYLEMAQQRIAARDESVHEARDREEFPAHGKIGEEFREDIENKVEIETEKEALGETDEQQSASAEESPVHKTQSDSREG